MGRPHCVVSDQEALDARDNDSSMTSWQPQGHIISTAHGWPSSIMRIRWRRAIFSGGSSPRMSTTTMSPRNQAVSRAHVCEINCVSGIVNLQERVDQGVELPAHVRRACAQSP